MLQVEPVVVIVEVVSLHEYVTLYCWSEGPQDNESSFQDINTHSELISVTPRSSAESVREYNIIVDIWVLES